MPLAPRNIPGRGSTRTQVSPAGLRHVFHHPESSARFGPFLEAPGRALPKEPDLAWGPPDGRWICLQNLGNPNPYRKGVAGLGLDGLAPPAALCKNSFRESWGPAAGTGFFAALL